MFVLMLVLVLVFVCVCVFVFLFLCLCVFVCLCLCVSVCVFLEDTCVEVGLKEHEKNTLFSLGPNPLFSIPTTRQTAYSDQTIRGDREVSLRSGPQHRRSRRISELLP